MPMARVRSARRPRVTELSVAAASWRTLTPPSMTRKRMARALRTRPDQICSEVDEAGGVVVWIVACFLVPRCGCWGVTGGVRLGSGWGGGEIDSLGGGFGGRVFWGGFGGRVEWVAL